MRTLLSKADQSSWWQTIRPARGRWAEVDGGQCAAAFAYYLLLSLLPLIVILVSIGSLFIERGAATHEIVQLLNRYTPLTGHQERAAGAAVQGLLEARSHISLAAFPLLTLGALKFLRTLIRTTNRLWRSPAYNWWRLPLKSLGLFGIIASVAVVGILRPATARLVRGWLIRGPDFPALQPVFAICLRLVRSQATVGETSWLKAMIPHHSIATLTSKRTRTEDLRERERADEIIQSQRREIAEMKALIAGLEAQK